MPTTKYIDFFMKRVNILVSNGVEPVIVFDGARLKSKNKTEESRRKSRSENTSKAIAYMKSGNMSLATKFFQKSVDISPSHVIKVIERLR